MAVAWADVTIASGQTVSNTFSLQDYRIIGIKFPAAMTGATVTFNMSVKHPNEGGTMGPVFIDPGTGTAAAFTLDTGANQATYFNGSAKVGGGWFQVVSASAEAATRVVTLILETLG